MIPLGLAAAALEVACAAGIFALVSLLSSPGASTGRFGQALEALGLAGVGPLLAVTAGLFLFKALITVATLHANHRAIESGRAALVGRLFAGLLDAPWVLHKDRGVVEATHDLLGRAGAVFDDVVGPAAQLAIHAATALGLLGLLLVTAPGVTLAVGGSLGVWLLLILGITRRAVTRASQVEDQASKAGLGAVWRALGALREIRTLGVEPTFYQHFVDTQRDLVRARYIRSTLSMLPRVFTETVFVLVMLGAVWWLHDPQAPPTLLSLLGLCAYVGLRLLPVVNGSVWQLNRIRWATPAITRLLTDHTRLAADQPRWMVQGPPPPATAGARITLDAVHYRWPEGDPVLRGAALVVEPGESVAIIGETGAGKSTLLHLLAGLVAADTGAVHLDGHAPREAQVRVGYVPQEVVLMDASIAANIALGRTPEPARLAEVVHVAGLDPVIDALPEGLEAPVGEGGHRLSGGQRQRVALARALYHRPALLLLDEATAALDDDTERLVIDRLTAALAGQTTLVVVTHRPGAARRCARTLRLTEGRLIPTA